MAIALSAILLDFLSPTITGLNMFWEFINSNFTTALAGAFAGAYGATVIAARIEQKQQTLTEIQKTIATINTTLNIFNSFCSIKNQFIKDLRENYDVQLYECHQHRRLVEAGEIPAQPFIYQADLLELTPIQTPIETLKNLSLGQISINTRAVTFLLTLSQSIDNYNKSLEFRNKIIYKCRGLEGNQSQIAKIYFGLPNEDGSIDKSYPDTIEGLYKLTDDCIFFSKTLCENLTTHGHSLAKSYGKNSPLIPKIQPAKAESLGLLPNEKNYKDYLSDDFFPK